MSKKIYISPANHDKPYAVAGNTEKQHMEYVGKKVCEILSQYDCTVFYPTVFAKDQTYVGRPQEAKKLGADVYVSIHSNAAAQMGAYATGCVGFYHIKSAESKGLAKAIQEKLDSICPIKSNRYESLTNGMLAFDGYGYGEVREPYNLGMTGVLIETNFHSYEPTAKWIIVNRDLIGSAIAETLVKFYSLKKQSGTAATVTPPTPESPKTTVNEGTYFLQVGAYRQKSFADSFMVQLRAANYPVYSETRSDGMIMVYVGKFTTQAAAQTAKTALEKAGHDALLKKIG